MQRLYFVMLIVLLFTTGCLKTMGIVKNGKITDYPINIDLERIKYNGNFRPIKVHLNVLNPNQVYSFMRSSSRYYDYASLQVGNALVKYSPIIWGKYLDIKPTKRTGLPTIEIDIKSIGGFGRIDFYSPKKVKAVGSRSETLFEISLRCKFFDKNRKHVKTIVSTKRYYFKSDQPNLSEDIMKSVGTKNNRFFESTFEEAYNDLLEKFFDSKKIAVALK